MVNISGMMEILTTGPYDAWFKGLKDSMARKRITARIHRMEDDNFGDCAPVGEEIFEMRIHCGPGYRIYFIQRGSKIIILLAGGDKSTQDRDIQTAINLSKQL
jgi:putative addiction module killer protein